MPFARSCTMVAATALALFLLDGFAMQPPAPAPDPPSMDGPGFQELALAIINDDVDARASRSRRGADAKARDPACTSSVMGHNGRFHAPERTDQWHLSLDPQSSFQPP